MACGLKKTPVPMTIPTTIIVEENKPRFRCRCPCALSAAGLLDIFGLRLVEVVASKDLDAVERLCEVVHVRSVGKADEPFAGGTKGRTWRHYHSYGLEQV